MLSKGTRIRTVGREQPIRILIADDHEVVRKGLAVILGFDRGMTVVAQARNGREAVELFRRERPDLALIGLKMAEMDGVAAIMAIREEFPRANLLVLATDDRGEDIFRSIRAGARAYVLKDAAGHELLAAMRDVAGGHRYLSRQVAAKLAEHVTFPKLTERELDVLQLLVSGKSNRAIGAALFISEGTVKTHLNNILSKLGAGDRTEAVTVALRRGLVELT